MALEGLLTELPGLRSTEERILAVRESSLSADRDLLYNQLLSEYAAEDFSMEAYKKVAEALYAEPSYLAEDYRDSSLALLKEVDKPAGRNSLYGQSAYGRELNSLFSQRMAEVKNQRYALLFKEKEELLKRKAYWEDQCRAMTEEGADQWNRGVQQLVTRRKRWRDDYKREYGAKSNLWEEKYDLLQKNKDRWLNASSSQAVESGTLAIAREMGLKASSLISEVGFVLIPDMTLKTDSLKTLVEEALEGKTLNRILAGMQGLSDRNRHKEGLSALRLPEIP